MSSQVHVEVISPDALRLRHEFMSSHTPVVIRGMFDSTPLGLVKSPHTLRQLAGDAVVHVKPNVVERYVHAVDPTLPFSWSRIVVKTTATTIRDYLDNVARNPDDDRIGSEQPAPGKIVELLEASPFLAELDADRLHPGKQAGRSQTAALVFLANRGNASDTHTDFDGRHVLSYQVFGRKKFVLFPPRSAPKLSPVEIFSMVKLRGMSERSLAGFLDYTDGVQVVLEPGDAIYMPPFYYHHVEYLDLAMGITLRFEAPSERLGSCIHHCHRDMWMQNVWAWIIQNPESPQAERALLAFEQALAAPYRSRIEKYRTIQSLARTFCAEWDVFGDKPTDPWLSSADFLEHLLSMRYVVGGQVEASGFTSKAARSALRELVSGSSRKAALWRSKEKLRFAAEMLGRRALSALAQA